MPVPCNAAPLAGLMVRCQPDSRLVTLSREGHEPAFEEIVRRYRALLVSFAGAIVPAHRAEDVVQEALAKAHAALAASEAKINLKPWLYTIVRNRALNDLRDEPTHEHLDESFDGVPQPPEVAARREALAALVTQVQGLPPAQREALIKRELEGRSHEEIAAALGATPGAARALIFRARTALRDAAGMLIPLPLLRALLATPPPEAAGAGAGGVAVGLTAGAGGGAAAKAGVTLLVAALAVGSGIALKGGRHGSPAQASAKSHHAGRAPESRMSFTANDPSARPAPDHAGGGRGAGKADAEPAGQDGNDAASGGAGDDVSEGRESGEGPAGGGEPEDRSGSDSGDSGEHDGSGGGGSDSGEGGSSGPSGDDDGSSGSGVSTGEGSEVSSSGSGDGGLLPDLGDPSDG